MSLQWLGVSVNASFNAAFNGFLKLVADISMQLCRHSLMRSKGCWHPDKILAS